MAEQIVVTLHTERDTPGTRLFKADKTEDGSRPAVANVYVTKEGLATIGNPANVRVTVEAL